MQRRIWQYAITAIAITALSIGATIAFTASGDDTAQAGYQTSLHDLAAVKTRLAAVERKQAVPIAPDPQIMKLRTRARALEDCLTEVDDRLSAMTIEDGETVYPYLDTTPLSRVCRDLLHPTTTTH